MLAGPLDYARRHRDIVARFGRFPHRNAVLGRPIHGRGDRLARRRRRALRPMNRDAAPAGRDARGARPAQVLRRHAGGARRQLRGARRRMLRPARPERRRQDHDAALLPRTHRRPTRARCELAGLPVPRAARAARYRVGVVPQFDNLDPGLHGHREPGGVRALLRHPRARRRAPACRGCSSSRASRTRPERRSTRCRAA